MERVELEYRVMHSIRSRPSRRKSRLNKAVMLAQTRFPLLYLAMFASESEPAPSPNPATVLSPAVMEDARPDPTPRRLDLGAFADPFGRVRYSDGDSDGASEWPRFEEYVDVEAKAPRTIQEISADWWKHWNIPKHGGPLIGAPTHKDLLEHMPVTPGRPPAY
jgi:hypothetical protein